ARPMAHERIAHTLDRLGGRDRLEHDVVLEHWNLRHARDDNLAAVSRNGKHSPPRPRIEITHASATPEEAAAIAAAIEQFLRDTTPPRSESKPQASGWQRAGLLEGVGLPANAAPWL